MEIFKFKPLLKHRLWGGERIGVLKGLSDCPPQIGESWEISGVAGCETVVSGGTYDGMPLNSLVATLRENLVGHANYIRFGNVFPLLIKLIDARLQSSIQVHPSDEQAHRYGQACGKTEMWYLIDAAPGATLRSGLKHPLTPDTYKTLVAKGAIVDAIAEHEAHTDDCFFLPAGRIHSLGAGCLIAEIQQTSDVTYRVYDFDRRDRDGRLRQLHTQEAAECIDYNVAPDYRTNYTPQHNKPVMLVNCDYFTTQLCDFDSPCTLDFASLDSFVILICLTGNGTVAVTGSPTVSVRAGETLLIPATATSLHTEGHLKFLLTYTDTH